VPTYDYQCRSCGRTIEVIHSMLVDGPTTCEVCGGELRRIIHPSGIIFKGTGFYKTDSRSSAGSGSSSRSASSKPAAKEGSSKEGAASGSDGSASTSAPSDSSGGSSTAESPKSSDPA
jgi:putative FmdB family regulatory protein